MSESASNNYQRDLDTANARCRQDRVNASIRPVGTLPCDGCRGDGIYYGRGIVENGVFKGFTGKCYRCGGKGFLTPEDKKRNAYYDNHVRRYSV